MKQIIFAATFLGAVLIGQFANAQPGARNINQRQHNQTVRIQQGVRHGDLTFREAQRLKGQQRQVQQLKRMAMADGRITPRERMLIAKAQNNTSNNIYRNRHNDAGRNW